MADWLAEYQQVMAEDLSLSGEQLDRLAPYAQPAPEPIPGLARLITATAPPSVRARRKSPDARTITLPRVALVNRIILTIAFVVVVIGVMRLTGVIA
jgi:hypothetical protein